MSQVKPVMAPLRLCARTATPLSAWLTPHPPPPPPTPPLKGEGSRGSVRMADLFGTAQISPPPP